MGGGKSQTSTQQVQIPPEVLARYNAVNARAETVAERPFQPYSEDPNAFVAPLTATQQAGVYNVNQAAGAAQPYYQQATDAAMGSYAGAQPLMDDAAGSYMGAQGASQPYYGQAQQQLYGGLDQAGAANQYASQQLVGAQGRTGPLQGQAQQNIEGALAGAQPFNLGAAQSYAQGVQAFQPYMQAATQGLGSAQGAAYPANMAALQSAAGASGQSQPYYQQATSGTQNALSAANPLNQAAQQFAMQGSRAIGPEALQTQQYMNPYTQNVVEATQRAMGQQFGQQQSQQQAGAIKAGAFGGDRAGIQRAILQGQQALSQSQAISPLYQQAYQQALQTAQQQQGVGLSAEQANRAAQQAAGQQLAALGQQQYGQQLGAAGQMANLGQALYGQGITGAQTLSGLGQTQFGQGLQAAQQQAALGQQALQAGMGYGQAVQGLGQQQYQQGLGAAQQQAALAQQLFGQNITGAQTAANLGQTAYGQGAGAAQQLAGLGQQQYQQALGLGQALQGLGGQQFTQGQQFAQGLAGLGTGAQQAALSGAQGQLAAGTTEQQTQQAGQQALYNQFQQERAYPFQLAQFLGNIAMGTGSLSGSTTTTTSPAGFFSDERLKENMRPVGKTNDGQTIYSFNYKGDKRTQIGLSAQEVAEKHPEAVGKEKVPGLGGAEALTVDYKKATSEATEKADGGALGDVTPMQLATIGGLRAVPIASPMQTMAAFTNPTASGAGGLGGAAPAMLTGNIPIQPFAGEINRAPKAEGQSLGTREGWEAELASLYNGRPLESGEVYGQQRRQQLTDKLAGIGAQPMVITPPQPPKIEEPIWSDDNWARGGYVDRPGYYGAGGRPERARGGLTDLDWANLVKAQGAALGLYGGQSPAGASGTPGGGGGYGAMGTKNPVAVSKLATAGRPPSGQPSGLAQAAATGQQLAALMKAGSGAYDWAKKKVSVTPGGDMPAKGAVETALNFDKTIDPGDAARAINLAKLTEDALNLYARGGRAGYALDGSVPYEDNDDFGPKEGPKAPNSDGSFSDLLGAVIKSGASQPKGNPAQPPSSRPQGGGSGIAGLTNAIKTGKQLYDVGSKAASALGSVLGGAGAETAAGAGLGAAGAEGVAGGLTGLGAEMAAGTGAGLGMLGAEAAGAGALGAAGAGAAGAAGAGAAGAAGALGAAGTGAALAEGGKAALAMLPFLSDPRSKHDDEVVGHLFNGQPVHTFKYNNSDNKTRMGLMTTESDRRAVRSLGDLEMLDYKKATDVAAGLAPRQAAQRGGPFVDPNMPAEGAVETALNVPRELQPLIAKASAETGIPASILAAKIAQESGFRPDAVGSVGEIGLTQIKPSTARDPGYGMKGVDPESLRDPQANILFGANYLANKARHLGLNPSSPEALMAYNAGPGQEKYAQKVMANVARYDRIVDAEHAGTPAAKAISKDLNRPGKPSPKKEDSFTDKLLTQDFLVPAIAGIGSMLASTRPTFGGALGQGLVGGTSAYTALQKQKADIEKTGNEARRIRIEAQQAAITRNVKGYPIYAIIDGKVVPFHEIYRNPDKYDLTPQLESEIAKVRERADRGDPDAIAATKSPTAPPPTNATPAATASTAAKTEKPEDPEKGSSFSSPITVKTTQAGGYDYNIAPVTGGYSDQNFNRIRILEKFDVAGNPASVGGAIQSVQALADKADKDGALAYLILKGADTASQTMRDLRQLASSINKLDNKGFATTGAGQDVRVNLIRYINSAVDMLGLDPKYKVSPGQVANTEIANKIRALGSVTAAKTGNQSAAQIANSIANALPSGKMTKDAANTLTAAMMIENQRIRDFQKFHSEYIGRYNTAYDVEKMFNKIMGPVYAKEKKILINAIKSYKTDGKSLSYADILMGSPERAAAFDKNMKSSGLARYWR